MSTLNSSSSCDDIVASYADSASYQEDGDAGKARAFCTACRLLLIKIPQRSSKGDSAIEMNVSVIKQQLDGAMAWLALNGNPTPPVTRAAFNNSRY